MPNGTIHVWTVSFRIISRKSHTFGE
jgi:hypothetical protein